MMLHNILSLIPIISKSNAETIDYSPPTIESVNAELLPVLNNLCKTSLFKYFKVFHGLQGEFVQGMSILG
jgi:hypothetical protein